VNVGLPALVLVFYAICVVGVAAVILCFVYASRARARSGHVRRR
jgi:hypothetical protein